MHFKFFALVLFLFCLTATLFADETPTTTDTPTSTNNQPAPYVQESIGNAPPPSKSTKISLFPTLPVSDWIGHSFVFQPMRKGEQNYGYQFSQLGDSFDGVSPALPYNDFVGRVGKVIRVMKYNDRDYSGNAHWYVTLKMIDNDQHVTAAFIKYPLDNFLNLAPVEDIETARHLWKGKTLWLIGSSLATYNDQTDKIRDFAIKRYSPVTITDIVAGWHLRTPIRFICKVEDGRIGFVDVHLSNTNVSESLRNTSQFAETFLTSDPKKTYPWDDKTWTAIKNGQLIPGMTQLQARMAEGVNPPKIVYKHTQMGLISQWCGYEDKRLSFVFLNDRLQIQKNEK